MQGSVSEKAAWDRQPVTMEETVGLTRGIDIRGYRKGAVLIPDSWSAADMTFLSSDVDDYVAAIRGAQSIPDKSSDKASTYSPVRTAAASAPLLRVLNIPTSGPAWMPLPAALFEGHAFIKARSTATGSEDVVDQGAIALTFRFSS